MNEHLPLIVANFKAHKNWEKVESWLEVVGKQASWFTGTIIVCPSAPFLAAAYQKLEASSQGSAGWRIKLGSQDLSKFEQGAYTGEVAASQISDIVDYCLIGHSERRQNFAEDEKILTQKVQNAINAGINPIFCVQNADVTIPENVKIVAYEPVFAIGTGNPDTPDNAQAVSKKLKAEGNYTVLYGGSVSDTNIKSFLKGGIIDGALIATNCLDPQQFIKVLEVLKS